jgi:GGDEF domain-containing protein
MRLSTITNTSYSGAVIEGITASFGVAAAPDSCSGDRLVTTADAALYQSKANGRNRVSQAPVRGSDNVVA